MVSMYSVGVVYYLLLPQVPSQEAPLPEGVGGQEAFEEGVCLREVESVWRERLHELTPPPTRNQSSK